MSDPTTKSKLLDTAERLFSANGFAGVSLRSIIKEAGVNTAAVHYHFGSKESLVRAVLERRVAPVNRARLDMLDDLEASGDAAIESIIEAFLTPAIALYQSRKPPKWLPRLIGRAITETDPAVRAVMAQVFAEVFRRFHTAFSRALPHLTTEEVGMRVHFMIGAMAFTVAFPKVHEDIDVKARTESPDALMRHLVAFVAAGMRSEMPQGNGGKTR